MTPLEAAARVLALRSARALGIPGPKTYAEDLWREYSEDARAAITAFLDAVDGSEHARLGIAKGIEYLENYDEMALAITAALRALAEKET